MAESVVATRAAEYTYHEVQWFVATHILAHADREEQTVVASERQQPPGGSAHDWNSLKSADCNDHRGQEDC